MTIDEAIKILNHYQVEGEAPCPPKLDDALKLGIEALKKIKRQRLYQFKGEIRPLPGETLEVQKCES
jgi:hypothetical protein